MKELLLLIKKLWIMETEHNSFGRVPIYKHISYIRFKRKRPITRNKRKHIIKTTK